MKNITKLLALMLSLLAITCFSLACAPSEGENNNPPQHTHSYSTNKFDDANHWKECSCGEKTEVTAHGLTDGKCSCGYEKEEGGKPTDPTHTHEYKTVKHDDANHWKECSCGEKAEVTAHSLTDGKCSCGYEKEEGGKPTDPTHTHEYKTVKYDDNNHWKECECGEKAEVTAHTGGEATCLKKATCATCGQDYGEYAAHSFVNNRCECGKYEPSYYTEGLVFELVDDEYSVTDYTGSTAEVVIPSVYNGKPVTSIGEYAFSYFTSLTSVVIPNSVISIGNSVFFCCNSLTSVVIHDRVESIGDYAFGGCASLTSVVIGDSVESIGYGAFASCDSLTSVVIPDSVTSIGSSAFASCDSLTSIEVSENNANYKSIDGNLYSKDGKTLIQYAIGKTATSFTILDSVTSIGDSAFSNCNSLTSVEIPDSVESIADYAFFSCTSLTSVVIGNSVTSIGEDAFEYCDSLTSVVIPNSVTSIGKEAFSDCTSLTSVEIGDSVTSIGDEAFSWCDSLTSVVIPDSVTSIGNDAFYSCTTLTSVVIGDSVESIGYGAFSYCDKLQFSEYGNCKYLGSDDNDYFVLIEATYEKLSSCTIHENTKIIAGVAFRNCTSLTSVVIPDSVESIGGQAFYNCDSLTSVEIGDSVTSIGDEAFSWCNSLTSVVIPDSVESIGSGPFSYCYSLISIEVSTDNANYKSIDGNLYSKDGKTLIQYAIGKTATSFTIPDSVTDIGMCAFGRCFSLTSVVIGDGVESIGDSAFENCYSLTSVEIPDSVESIGEMAFSQCHSLTSVVIGNSVTSIGEEAFEYCDSLTSVVIPDSVTSIGESAFRYCDSLTSVVIPDSVTSIGYWAFEYCTSLTIYCEAESQPGSWNSNWNVFNRPVVWGYKG